MYLILKTISDVFSLLFLIGLFYIIKFYKYFSLKMGNEPPKPQKKVSLEDSII